MTDKRTPSQQLKDAELEIAEILETLEQRTGKLVGSISIESTDVTTGGNDRQQLSRRVAIELNPAPGSNWVTT